MKLTVIGLVPGPLPPLYVKGLMGAELSVNMMAVLTQIMFIVSLLMAAGFVTQQPLIKKYGQKTFQQSLGPKLPRPTSSRSSPQPGTSKSVPVMYLQPP